MLIYWQGYFVLLVTVAFFLLNPKSVIYISIFLIPFSATAAIKTGNGFPISPFLLTLPFNLVYMILGKSGFLKPAEKKVTINLILPLILFFVTIYASTLMPLIIDGNLWITNTKIYDEVFSRVEFNAQNFKYPIPTAANILFSILIVIQVKKKSEIHLAAKTYVSAGLFVAIWGCLQFICNLLGYEYPSYIFNNSDVDSMLGYQQTMDTDVGFVSRISSVMHEPAILSKYLWGVLVLLVINKALGSFVFSRGLDILIVGVISVAISLSTSSTGYIGFVFFIIILLVTKMAVGKVRIPTGVIMLLVIILFLIFSASGSTGVSILRASVIDKILSGSFEERMYSIATSFEYFTEYPVLGIGWGVATSHDLVVLLLVNSGIVGLIMFSYLIINTLTVSVAANKFAVRSSSLSSLSIGCIAAIAIVTMNGLVAGLEFYIPNYFFMVGLTRSIAKILIVENSGEVKY